MKTTLRLISFAFALFITSNTFAATTYELEFKQQKAVDCNNADNCALGESLLGLNVTDNMDGTVTFKFSIEDDMDASTDGGSIKKIAFGNVTSLITNPVNPTGMGVVYYGGPTSGNASPLQFDGDFIWDAVSPAPKNGVNEGEMWSIMFDLVGMTTVLELVNSIASHDAGTAVIGLHVISIEAISGYDSSETFTAVPIPAAVWLFGSALAGMVGWRRREVS